MPHADDPPPAAAPPRWRWRPLHHLRARPRLSIAGGLFLAIALALAGSGIEPAHAVLLGFDAGALFYLGAIARFFGRATPEHMRSQARAMDTGRWGVLWSGLVLTAVVLVALGTELRADQAGGLVALVVAALTLVLSWLFINTMFAQHYAHGYYGDFGKQHQGLDFPKTDQPDYWDFMYFALVIGMCFQVSDVQVTSRTLRRTVLLHSVIAFFFNVFIIAISVNIVAGKG
ncbi:hypothetical protein ASG87_03165 [Frateuria sp. Soil773]|uniref:DUF1345 domain-containing protein n=1 Tax=Frateuria sp. Soil773 TaxID=1736407 RepID=UPI0006FE7846|nr:DUF1345 domain-containing protein [Frateuria sp. Soil773]KRE89355.1 hypothetical protein ASG87_03165 [Frateuria sp. Soil773]